jgi:hypothetical protein
MMNLGLMDAAFLGSLTSYDPDAAVYIAAVEAADGQELEAGVKTAIDNFVRGCKIDGIWNAIKASCILAGARTLTGALVPLKGAAPTNFNFVAGDYNRKTGLVGNGTTKYLDSNRNNNADPQNSKHLAVYISQAATLNGGLLGSVTVTVGGFSHLYTGFGSYISRNNSTADAPGFYSGPPLTAALPPTLFGTTRNSSGSFNIRVGGVQYTQPAPSAIPDSGSILVFSQSGITNARLAFYSIGESLDLALLDARVTALVNALAVAIP